MRQNEELALYINKHKNAIRSKLRMNNKPDYFDAVSKLIVSLLSSDKTHQYDPKALDQYAIQSVKFAVLNHERVSVYVKSYISLEDAIGHTSLTYYETVEDEIDLKNKLIRLHEAIDRLPKGQRNAVLTYLEHGQLTNEMPHYETTKAQFRNALIKLRSREYGLV